MDNDKNFFLTQDVSACCDIKLRERVRVLLLRLGKTQNWLADMCSVNKGTMSKIINGYWLPTSLVKLRMAQALQVDTIVLFGHTQYWRDYTKTFKERENGN